MAKKPITMEEALTEGSFPTEQEAMDMRRGVGGKSVRPKTVRPRDKEYKELFNAWAEAGKPSFWQGFVTVSEASGIVFVVDTKKRTDDIGVYQEPVDVPTDNPEAPKNG